MNLAERICQGLRRGLIVKESPLPSIDDAGTWAWRIKVNGIWYRHPGIYHNRAAVRATAHAITMSQPDATITVFRAIPGEGWLDEEEVTL